MSSSAKQLRKYVSDIANLPATHRKLWVFDFDDTLVRTASKIYVTRVDGSRYDLTPAQFAAAGKVPGETYDYSDFYKLLDPKPVKWMNRVLGEVYARRGPKNIRILSARSSDIPIRQYLATNGWNDIDVFALDNSHPDVKSSYVDSWLENDVLDELEFFDDSRSNVLKVKALQDDWPTVKIVGRTIVYNRIASLWSE